MPTTGLINLDPEPVETMRPYLLPVLLLLGCAPGPRTETAPVPDRPRNVILMIADGTGIAYWTAARMAAPRFSLDRFAVVGLVDTQASNSRVTDSAAGATAFASGVRTYNGAIGVTADTVPVPTILEMAQEQGKATGLVATSRINHATPAAFAAHVPHRGLYSQIVDQMLERSPTVMIGGGRGFFDGSLRPDSQNVLLPVLRRYTYVESVAQLRALDPDTVETLLGLLAVNDLPAYRERGVELEELTATAIRVLDRDDDGFFLMVEGSQIDWRGHDNADLSYVVEEVLDFDRAVGAALDYQAEHPATLVVVTADHETGGLALHANRAGKFVANYTTTGHTAEMVPLFAIGPGAERFGGIRDNHVVGQILIDLTGGEQPAVAGSRP